MKYLDIENKLNEIDRTELLYAGSAVSDFFIEFVESLKPDDVIEIGTFHGLSTVALASIARHVYTFDIACRDVDYMLGLFGLRNKVSKTAAQQEQIDFEINLLRKGWGQTWRDRVNFNFAFIDGDHEYEAVRHDFGLVKFCKRVLFHDVHHGTVKRFVIDELGAKVVDDNGYFGYWEAS